MDRIEEKEFEVLVKAEDPKDPKKEIVKKRMVAYISKIPAVAGREIMIKYAQFAKDAYNYDKSHEISGKLLSYVRVKLDNGNMVALDTDTLINNHVDGADMLMALEAQVMDYTFGFLADGETSNS